MDCYIWDVHPLAFQVGPFAFTWYGLMFGLFFFTTYGMTEWYFQRANTPPKNAFLFLTAICVASLVGAFVFHRVFYEWETLVSNPASLFSMSRGITGLASHGAILGSVMVLLVYYKVTRCRFLELADRCAYGGALCVLFIRIGNLFNSEVIGAPTDLPWAICLTRVDTVPRHPSQIYEALIGLTVFITLFIVDKRLGRKDRPVGLLIGLFLAQLFTLRFFVEFLKAKQALSDDAALTMGQYLSLPAALLGAALIVYSLKYAKRFSFPKVEEKPA